MAKLDYTKERKDLYAPSAGQITIVDVPEFAFLSIEGEGAPDSEAYHAAVEALYAVAYGVKFAVKKAADGIDYRVLPLEGLWSWGEGQESYPGDRSLWRWTAMIRQPGFVTQAIVDAAKTAAAKKKSLPALPLMRFSVLEEGRCVQLLHIGPYAAEHDAILRMRQFIVEHGLRWRGPHHEIYLSDPGRTAPEKLRTVLREPVEPGSAA